MASTTVPARATLWANCWSVSKRVETCFQQTEHVAGQRFLLSCRGQPCLDITDGVGFFRFGIDDIEADHSRFALVNVIDEPRLCIARPGPSSNFFEALLVNQYEHDFLPRTSFAAQAELKIQRGVVQAHDDVGSQPREKSQPDRDSHAQADAEWDSESRVVG